jgi:hypothetical protein
MRNFHPSQNRHGPKLPRLAPGTASAPRQINLWITVAGTPPSSSWRITIETGRYPSRPLHLLVLGLPTPLRNPSKCLKYLGGDDYAIRLRLEEAAAPAQFASLFGTTTAELAPALREIYASWPAAIAICIAKGRVSIITHQP